MIRTLNSLRFILIMMVVVSHSTLPISQAMKDYLGECPVAIFFVVSGFVLALSKGEKLRKGEMGNGKFFLSRAVKLYPLHLLLLAVTFLFDWRLGHIGTWYQTLAHAMLLQCWIPTHQFALAYNGVAWFISDIIFFYLVFKYLYGWIINNSWGRILSVMGVYMAGYVLLSFKVHGDYSSGFVYFFPLFRLIDFMLGILVYKFYISQSGKALYRRIGSLSSLNASVLAVFGVAMMVGMYPLSMHCNPNFRCAALYWIPSVLTLYYMVSCDNGWGWLTRLLHSRLLLWGGSVSMEIFLCHLLVLRLVQSVFVRIYGEDIPCLTLQFFVALLLTLLMALGTKKYVVKPASTILRQWL